MKPTVMNKIVGVALSEQRQSIMDYMTKLGCIEFVACDVESVEGVTASVNSDDSGAAELKLAKIAFANDFIKNEKIIAKSTLKDEKLKAEKKPLIARKPEIDFDEFVKLEEQEAPIFERIEALEQLNNDIVNLKAEEMRSKSDIEAVRLYTDFKLKLCDYADTQHSVCKLGIISNINMDALSALGDAFSSLTMQYYPHASVTAVCLVALRSEWQAISDQLSELSFQEANLISFCDTADNIMARERFALVNINERRAEITRTVMKEYLTNEFTAKLNITEDYYKVQQQKIAAAATMSQTQKTFRFEGWLPSNLVPTISDKLEQSEYDMAFITREAREGEVQPTLLMDNAIVTPYQSVTNMFSVPNVNEVNPNPFVSVFFIVFFGIMLSDAGYGLILSLITGIVLAIARPRRREMSLIKIVFMGGFSTMFWGVMFGGYFGMELLPAVLFNPLDDPMSMLILSLGLGLVHMMTGMAINAYSLFKQKKPLEAFFGVFSWYFLIIGVAMFALAGGIAWIKYTGIALLALGLFGLMAAGTLHKRGMKKVSGAFGGLYGLVGFFSDLLSYSRLFGLGLATGVIAMVFNQMAQVFFDLIPIVGYVIGIGLLLVGHIFNIAINTLGAYVHNSRLQFIEFFNKFYTGGGELFHPLGSDMKHYNFVQQQEDK